jgi:hypothetical protein
LGNKASATPPATLPERSFNTVRRPIGSMAKSCKGVVPILRQWSVLMQAFRFGMVQICFVM